MKRFVNSIQTPEERRHKYKLLLAEGATSIQARRYRDWTMGCIERIAVPAIKKNAT